MKFGVDGKFLTFVRSSVNPFKEAEPVQPFIHRQAPDPGNNFIVIRAPQSICFGVVLVTFYPRDTDISLHIITQFSCSAVVGFPIKQQIR